MLFAIAIVLPVTVSARLGWTQPTRRGLAVSLLLPAALGLAAATFVAVPATSGLGALWVFVLVFVALAVTALVSFGVSAGVHAVVAGPRR